MLRAMATRDARTARSSTVEGARPHTLESLTPPAGPSRWRQLPATSREAIALVRRAAPREALTTFVLQVILAGCLAGQLILAKLLLDGLISVNSGEGELSGLLGEFLALIGLVLVMGMIAAAMEHQSRLLSEKVSNYVLDEIIRVSNQVELDSFEDPVFYDQLQRARSTGVFRPIQMVNSLTTITTALLASVGVGVVLFALAPVLLAAGAARRRPAAGRCAAQQPPQLRLRVRPDAPQPRARLPDGDPDGPRRGQGDPRVQRDAIPARASRCARRRAPRDAHAVRRRPVPGLLRGSGVERRGDRHRPGLARVPGRQRRASTSRPR